MEKEDTPPPLIPTDAPLEATTRDGAASASSEDDAVPPLIQSSSSSSSPVVTSSSSVGGVDTGLGQGKEVLTNGTPESDGMGAIQEEEIDTFPILVKTCTDKRTVMQLQVGPMDSISDIRQFLFDSVDTCYITSYNLFVNEERLNEYMDLADIPSIKPDVTLEMREALYDEKSIRFHVRRLREILKSPESTNTSTLFSQISPDFADNLVPPPSPEQPKAEGSKENNNTSNSNNTEPKEIDDSSSLANFFPSSQEGSTSAGCLRSIVYSGWNPPPGNRKLLGDLIYLEITTLDNRTLYVTGWSNGFFVNASTGAHFNPTPSDKPFHSHHLVGLLSQLSPVFKKNFQSLLTKNAQRHPFEILPVPYPVTSWVAQKEKHSYDLNRAEDSLLSVSETDGGPLRDWNEEYQSCFELPRETIQERIIRDRHIFKLTCDFVDAATRGACAIINKAVPPINPLDPDRAHMYIYNNIFFSYATDGRDFYKEYGGDRAAYVSVNNDLKGIKEFNRADIKGLYTLATAIVDYRGHRLCAQSIIPGILQREQTSTVVYGSIDNGKKISGDEKFHQLVAQAGKALHIKEHTVVDSEGKEVKLCTPVESKGIVGTDGRRYILDLIRITPRDANFSGKHNLLTILRPELVARYCDFLRQQEIETKRAQRKEAQTPQQQENQTSEPVQPKPDQKQEEQLQEEDLVSSINYALNPNVLFEYTLRGTAPGEIEQDEKMVQDASKLLVEMVIPGLVEDFCWLLSVPVDGQTLTTIMHSRGINMRYLGLIAKLATDKIAVIQELALREMITRAAKHILRKFLSVSEDYNLSPVIAHFLNCFMGDVTQPAPQQDRVQLPTTAKSGSKKNKKKKPTNAQNGTENSPVANSLPPSSSLSNIRSSKDAFDQTSATLWLLLQEEVKSRFSYDLTTRQSIQENVLGTVSTLRSICQKVGIQVLAKDYDFTQSSPFQIDDIVNLFPLVKHTDPQSADGHNLLEHGKTFYTQGRLDIAYELLTEALAIFHQVYGPMHRDTANCYGNLAMVLYYAKDTPQALDHQQKATIINEKVFGLDHHDTSHSYGNLALFCHTMNKSQQALSYIEHAMYLGLLVCGTNHPDIATTYTNIAMMLQDLSRFKEAIRFLVRALNCYEALYGPNDLQTAAIYHAIALAYGQLDQYKEALAYEKKNYAILHTQVGDNDLRAIESNICLKQFTAKAVQMQIETKKAQREITSQLSQGKLENLKSLHLPPGPGSASGSTAGVAMGNRSLNEILSYLGEKPASGRSFLQRNQQKFNFDVKKKLRTTKKKAKTKDTEDNSEDNKQEE